MPLVEPSLQMWLTFALTGAAIVAFALELLPAELIALGILGGLLLLFQVMPLIDPSSGMPLLGPQELLQGFASPALIAVSSLLVIGQAMVSTGALESVARGLLWIARGNLGRAVGYSLLGVGGASGFLNNTPLVVIFMPILRSMAERHGSTASRVMMPLSFAAILGGMLTLIGTSTNLLVSGELARLGGAPLAFFDLTVPALVLFGVGMLYVLALPRLLPRREDPTSLVTSEGRQFIAELDIGSDSPLISERARGGIFPSLAGVTVRLVQRGEQAILPPFEDLTLEAGDILIVAASRRLLTEMLSKYHGHLLDPPAGERPAPRGQREMVLAEAMVRPASRIVGQTLELTNFPARSHCTVLGVQRRARMLRTRLGSLRLAPGDVLLLLGFSDQIERLRADPDVLLMEWSASEMPMVHRAPVAALIFAGVVVPAALDLVPIVVTALLGVLALVASGCLNVRQAARAVDRQIVLIIAAALGLGTALDATGAAAYLAGLVLEAMAGAPPSAILSVLFLLVAIVTNVLTNNATAILFTPVAVNLAHQLGADVFPFALAVAFGASCSFATPIGYQTNLLVMGPGQYRFRDFVLAGLPLVVIVWIAFSMFVPWYYGV